MNENDERGKGRAKEKRGKVARGRGMRGAKDRREGERGVSIIGNRKERKLLLHSSTSVRAA